MEAESQAFISSLESQPRYSENTRLAYHGDLASFLNYLHKKLDRSLTLDDFNAQNVISFLESERLSGRRLGTLLRRLATLRQFESFLIQEGYLQASRLQTHARLIHQPLTSLPRKSPPECLSAEHLQRLWECLAKSLGPNTLGSRARPLTRRDHAMLAILLETGLSVSDLIAMDLNDLDLRAKRIHLSPPDGQDAWLPLGEAVQPVAVYLKEGRPELIGSPDQSALFVSQGGKRMSRQGVWQVLRHWGKIAQIPYPLSPRLVRHTAVLRMLQLGQPISKIQTLLGHSNFLSTQALLRRLQAVSNSGE